VNRFLIFLGLSFYTCTCLRSQTIEDRRDKIEGRERAQPSNEASDRKARSISRLRKEGVPAIDHLPVIEDSKSAKTRTAEEIANRAIAVCLTAAKGEGIEQETIDSLVKKFGAEKFFSPKEAAFIKNPNPTQQDRIQFSWRYECYWVLLWSLGYIDSLDRPEEACDVAKAVVFLRNRDAAQFIKDAKLRPITAILDEADLIYRYDWAVVDARVHNKDAPAKLEKGVVKERHYALNWLIGYMNQEWDDISTDT
jgi:hypothetical protein